MTSHGEPYGQIFFFRYISSTQRTQLTLIGNKVPRLMGTSLKRPMVRGARFKIHSLMIVQASALRGVVRVSRLLASGSRCLVVAHCITDHGSRLIPAFVIVDPMGNESRYVSHGARLAVLAYITAIKKPRLCGVGLGVRGWGQAALSSAV